MRSYHRSADLTVSSLTFATDPLFLPNLCRACDQGNPPLTSSPRPLKLLERVGANVLLIGHQPHRDPARSALGRYAARYSEHQKMYQ